MAPMNADGGAGVLALPDDVQVDILRRLRAHSLARCRCVCAPWRGLVDARGLLPLLLRTHAPPRAFPGFFANTVRRAEPWKPGPAFLPPPTSRAGPAAVDDRLAFLRPHLSSRGGEGVVVRDQCDGLLLCFQPCGGRSGEDAEGFVCNPTTERWARLPPPPTPWPRGRDGLFLAFDPAVSPEYEVFLLPVPPPRRQREEDGSSVPDVLLLRHVTLGMFVPESFGKQREAEPEPEDEKKMLPLLVFSSANRRWRRRLFAPGRHAPARLYDKVTRRRRRGRTGSSEPDAWPRTWRSAVYRRGTLYALCERRVVVVLRRAESTYDMVRLPADATERFAAEHVLSSLPGDAIFSSTGDDHDAGVMLRYASVDAFRVKVWALREPAADDGDGPLSWALTHDTDLAAHARMLPLLHDAPSNRARCPEEDGGAGTGGKCVWFPDEDAAGGDAHGRRWNWDDAGLFDMEVGEGELLGDAACSPSPFAVLGCHPSPEVVYLASGAFHVVACHLGCPGKVRYMGRVLSLDDGDRLDGVFAYRPCIVDALPPYSCPFPSLKTVIKSH